jgi:hypothetical protein
MIYRCKDRTCGAEDCSTCFPFNEHEMKQRADRDERDQIRGDYERDMRKDEG